MRRRAVFKNGDCNILQSRISKRRLRYLQDIFTTLVDSQWRWTLTIFAIGFVGTMVLTEQQPFTDWITPSFSRLLAIVCPHLVADRFHPWWLGRRSSSKQSSWLRMDTVCLEHSWVHFLLPLLHWDSAYHRLWCSHYHRRMSGSRFYYVLAKYCWHDYTSVYGKCGDRQKAKKYFSDLRSGLSLQKWLVQSSERKRCSSPRTQLFAREMGNCAWCSVWEICERVTLLELASELNLSGLRKPKKEKYVRWVINWNFLIIFLA